MAAPAAACWVALSGARRGCSGGRASLTTRHGYSCYHAPPLRAPPPVRPSRSTLLRAVVGAARPTAVGGDEDPDLFFRKMKNVDPVFGEC